MLTKLNKLIPEWLKIVFFLIMFSVLVIKLLGFTVLGILSSRYYCKMFYIIASSVAGLYFIFNIIILSLFVDYNLKISKVLTDFLIDWLETIKLQTICERTIREFKTETYYFMLFYF
jgi:hypothetical protein